MINEKERKITKNTRKIENEFDNLNDLIYEIRLFTKRFKAEPPKSFSDKCIIAKTLESFYDGIENIFRLFFETIGI